MTLVAGTTYVLSYTAYTDATTGTRTMTAGIGQNATPWVALTSNPALTSTPTTFTYTYTVAYTSPDVSRVLFDMGSETGYVFIDDVSLEVFVDTTPPTAFTATAGTVGAFSMELLLTAADDSGTVTYGVSYGTETAQTTGASGVETSFTISGLTPETAYSFAVSASDASGNIATNNPITVSTTTVADTSTACAGVSSELQGAPAGGSLNGGSYDYTFETLANGDVSMTFELSSTVTGLVAYAHKESPFTETQMTVSGNAASINLSGYSSGDVISYAVKFAWAASGLAITKFFTYKVGDDCSTAGVDDFFANSVKLHPNPANGVVRFSTVTNEALEVSVYDLLGKQVIPVRTVQSELNISSLNPGMYFVNMKQGTSVATKKLLVN